MSLKNPADVQPLFVTKENKFLWDISRDGRFVLLAKEGGTTGISDLWIQPLQGHEAPWQYLETGFQKGGARFSPNTRWVAYQADESRTEVYVESFPERQRRSQVSTAGGAQPRWRRDGKELFYIGPDARLMAVPVKTEGDFEAGIPTPLFHLPASMVTNVVTAYDVDPRGQRFLIGDVARPAIRSPIVVVLNWTEALKK